jgi:hypothetical protein
LKRQITGAVFGLLALGTFIPGSATVHTAPADAPTESPAEAQGMVLHDGVLTGGEDTVVFRVGGTGVGNDRYYHFETTAIPNDDPSTTADACGTLVVYQEDGVWYAESISLTRLEDGEVEVNRHSGSRPVGPRGR